MTAARSARPFALISRRECVLTLGLGLSGASLAGAQDAAGDGENGPREASFSRDYPEPDFQPSWAKPQINRTMAADFVIYAHSDLRMTTQLLDREPGLLNAAIDWGNGDYETALGGASHMGQRDIVEFLLSRGARPDLFTLAMLGQTDALKSLLAISPELIDASGPHGFSLHFHAAAGGEAAKPTLDYLQSVKSKPIPPVPWLAR